MRALTFALPGALLALGLAAAPPDEEAGREPVALAAGATPGSLLVACANGVVARIDGEELAGSTRVAAALADLVALDGGRAFAATDPERGEVLLLSRDGREVVARRTLPRPTSVAQAGEWLAVASTWPRELTRLPLDLSGEAETLALPFSPGELLWTGARLAVADAFGGFVALVDVERWELVLTRELPASNVRGLALSPDGRLLLAHQIVDPLARTSFDDVHWGNLVRNVVRAVPASDLAAGSARSFLAHLGDVGDGAADPSGLALAGGRWLVPLAGTDELLVRDAGGEERRHPVGRRPVAVLARGGRAVVANSLDDTLTIVDLEGGDARTVALADAGERDAVARGRSLFTDASLSHDGWMSCDTCHTSGHSSGRLADTLGDGTYGTPKRSPSLLGVAATAPYAWNGSQPTLEAQIEKTLRTTMHAERVDDAAVADLAAYLRSLPAPPPPDPTDPDAADRGRALFASSGCTDCHAPPLYTTPETYVVGLVDEAGADHFNPPSLRGVGQRARLFHDGRYRALEQLIAEAGHPGTEALDARGIRDVAAFLRVL